MGVVYPFAGTYENLLFSPSPHFPVHLLPAGKEQIRFPSASSLSHKESGCHLLCSGLFFCPQEIIGFTKEAFHHEHRNRSWLFCREKPRHFSFPAGISAYSYEPYTLQNTLEYGGQYFVCGTGRQPILRNKTENRNYYLLTLAAIAKEIRQRGEKTECSVTIGAGLPLTLFGREKKAFREYLLYPEKPEDSLSPVCFKF